MNSTPHENPILAHLSVEAAGAFQLKRYELPDGNPTFVIVTPDNFEDWSQEQSSALNSLICRGKSDGVQFSRLILEGFHQQLPHSRFSFDLLNEKRALAQGWFLADIAGQWLTPSLIMMFMSYDQQLRDTVESRIGTIARYVAAAARIEPQLDIEQLKSDLASTLKVSLEGVKAWELSYSQSLALPIRRVNLLADVKALRNQQDELRKATLKRMRETKGPIFVLTSVSNEEMISNLIREVYSASSES